MPGPLPSPRTCFLGHLKNPFQKASAPPRTFYAQGLVLPSLPPFGYRKMQDPSHTALDHPSKGTLATTKPVLLGATRGRGWDCAAGPRRHLLPPGPSSPLFLSCWQSRLALKFLGSWQEGVIGGGVGGKTDRQRMEVFSRDSGPHPIMPSPQPPSRSFGGALLAPRHTRAV